MVVWIQNKNKNMSEKIEVPTPPENPEKVREEKTKEFLLKWKELFIALNSEEIEVFIYGDENFPNYRMIEDWSRLIVFSRLDGLVHGDSVRLVIKFSGKLRANLGSVALELTYDNAFFDRSIHGLSDPEWLDTLGEHGMITWQGVYDEIFAIENARREEVSKPPEAK
jgi:hypothetical protein